MTCDHGHSYVHQTNEHPLIGLTVSEFLDDVVAAHSECEALVSLPQRIRWTYAQLHLEVERVARGLLGLGVARGDRVGIWSTNCAEWVLLQLATARIGAILVNVNPAYRLAEVRHAMTLAEVQHLFLIPSFRASMYLDMMLEICPEARTSSPEDSRAAALPHLRSLTVWSPDDAVATTSSSPGVRSWSEFLALERGLEEDAVAKRAASVDHDDPVNIQFTSGTTGFPKAVVLTHHNILNNAAITAGLMSFTARDRLCVPLPFYHCFGMVVSNLVCLTQGACIVIPSDHFEAGAALHAIATERCTAIHGVPTMFLAELDHPDFGAHDLSSLRTGIMAGAPCPPELMRRVIEEMGCRELLIGYGQTEASPLTNLTRPSDSFERRVKTVGLPLPHQECKVVDTGTGKTLPVGEAGEVCFRGFHVMRGYYGQPEETRQVIDEAGWLHSGDIGVLDSDGYLAITGRLKDMIIRGGENIYPAEIEAIFYEHPAVDEIAVFGLPDEKYGEAVGAWIRLHEGRTETAEDLFTFARRQMAHFKVPSRIWFVQEFPMTVTGKIRKDEIRRAMQGSMETTR